MCIRDRINDAKQKPGLRNQEEFTKIYGSQLERLICQAQKVNLPIEKSAKRFEEEILEKVLEIVKKS